MENDKTPRNEQGQPPTRSATETEERLEEKGNADRGQANKDRIAAKISQLKDERSRGVPTAHARPKRIL